VRIAASLLPHGLKRLFDQTRPDRLTALGHLHGIPFSGKRLDAFHALHMGALASAAGGLSTWPRRAIRAVAVALSLTRIVVLAHWRCCQNVLQWHASTTPVAFGVEIARGMPIITGRWWKSASKEVGQLAKIPFIRRGQSLRSPTISIACKQVCVISVCHLVLKKTL
jgi:hypothetical protein